MASIVVHLPDHTSVFDPDPAITGSRDVTLVGAWDDETIGVVGWSSAGLEAVRTAIEHPELERLVLVATPFDDGMLSELDLDAVGAKTLLLFGSADPDAGSGHGRSWQRHLPNARLEMVPRAGPDLLGPMWKRILSHLAPGRKRLP